MRPYPILARFLPLAAVALLVAAVGAAPSARADFSEGVRAYQSGNFNRAFALAQVAAKRGDAEAQAYLGIMYQYGQGTRLDPREAARWYGMAAEQGHAQAQINLGVLHASGQGVAHDMTEALKWFTLAAQGNNPLAEQNRILAERKATKRQVEEARQRAAEWLKARGKELKPR